MNKPLIYAKIIGTLLIITSILATVSLIIALDRGIGLPTTPFQSSEIVSLPMAPGLLFVLNAIALIAGYGLIKSKLYGVYAFILLTIIQFLLWLSGPVINFWVVLNASIPVYFFLQRKAFKK